MTDIRTIIGKITDHRILSFGFILVGAFGLWISTFITNPYTILYPIGILFAVPTFYVIKDRGISGFGNNSTTIGKFLSLTFVISLTILVWAYYSNGFFRNDIVFYITFLLYLIVGLFILHSTKSKYALLLIVTAGLVNRLTGYYASSLYVGNDYYSHFRWINEIATTSSIEPLIHEKYYYAPLYHILGAISEITLTISTSNSIALTIVIASAVIPVLAIYSVSTRFLSEKVSLIACLFFISSDYAIQQGHYAIPPSMGLIIFSVIFMCLIIYESSNNTKIAFLLFVFMMVLSLSHQVSMFITCVFISSYFATKFLINRNVYSLPPAIICSSIVYLDFNVTRRGGPLGELTFMDAYLGLVVSRFLEGTGTSARDEVSLPPDPNISGTSAAGLDYIHVMGPVILLLFAVSGSLYLLYKINDRESTSFVLKSGVAIGVMYMFTFSLPIFAVGDLLPTRWFPFIYILLSILAAPALVAFVNIGGENMGLRYNTMITGVLIMVLLPYVVLMGGNHAGATDGPYFDDAPAAERFGFTETEKVVIEHTLSYNHDNRVVVDRRTRPVFERYHDADVSVLEVRYNEPDSIQRPSLLLARSYIHTSQSQYYLHYQGVRYTVAGPFPIDEVRYEDRSTIYNNGEDQLISVQ